jgi:glycosyltransferase involved in cell wall biosynthesis
MSDLPKKIAILLPSLKFGGGERVSLNLAIEMKRLGVEVDILVMSKEGEFLAEAEKEFTVHDLKCKKTYKLPYRLWQYLVGNRPNALISNFWKLNLCACLSRVFFPFFRLLLWEHSPPSKAPFAPIWIYALLASLLYQFSSKIVAVSNGVRDDIHRHTFGLSRKILTIYNPIIPPNDSLMRNVLPKLDNRPQIISVGRLSREKNPELLLHAFSIMVKKVDATLLIVGDGYLRKKLELLCIDLHIVDRVKFYGFSNYPYELMGNSDLLVLSSDLEGLPTAIIEAFYCGLPVVSTDCPCGPSELLMNGKYGSLVPVNDHIALAKAMEHELLNRRARDIQQSAANRFLPEIISQQFLCLIK